MANRPGIKVHTQMEPARSQTASSHVELGEALPHEPGRAEAGDGRVHLQRGLGELLMQDMRGRGGSGGEGEGGVRR